MALALHASFAASVSEFMLVDKYNAGVQSYESGLFESSAVNMEEFLDVALSIGLENVSAITSSDLDNAAKISYKSYVEISLYPRALRVLDTYFSYKDISDIETPMVANKVLISGNLNKCSEAVATILSANRSKDDGGSDIMLAFLSTPCSITKPIIDYIIASNQSNDIKAETALKIKKTDWLLLLSASIDFQKLSVEKRDSFAQYFFKVEAYEPFWELVGNYTSATTVSLSLKRLHQVGSYDQYIKLMNMHTNNYTLPSDNYCLLIDAYKQTDQTYDCQLIEKCSTSNLAYNKAVCYSEFNQWELFHREYVTLSRDEKKDLCVVAPYVVANGVYTNEMLDDFKTCKTEYKEGVQKSLYGRLDSDGLLYFSTGTTSTDLYYRTYGYILKNDTHNATATASRVGNRAKQAELYRVIKNSQNISTQQ